ncbi:MAG: glutamate 5-kinase [Candidatus Omnitrophota bacterium]|nr:MAG: glutamate 5-kinase [Candidatus Omnitrophota bacterium]
MSLSTQSEKNYKRIVIKIGSSLFFKDCTQPDFRLFHAISSQIQELLKDGKEVILVSSGAIAHGMYLLHRQERPKELSLLQSMSAIGQNALMNAYAGAFEDSGYHVAQILLTWDDFADSERYLNAKNTILSLLKLKGVPIINENDTISTEEIKFGDNDRLSALVAGLVFADLLVILSDVDGLLDNEKKVIKIVKEITPQIKSLACPTGKKVCVGGMVTKIEAARIAIDSGIPCLITNGNIEGSIVSAVRNPGGSGTLFMPKKGLKAKKRWIAFSAKTKGKVMVDEGAQKALRGNKSLLSVGIISCSGNFEAGDIVFVADKDGILFAKGKIAVSSKQLERIKGSRYHKEIIHLDNIVIL